VKPGPATGRRKRALALRVFLACPALIVLGATETPAQTLTSEMLRPARDGFLAPQDSPLRRTSENVGDKSGDAAGDEQTRDKDKRAPSRIGAIPTYDVPPASGASQTGFDSLNRKRRRQKAYPGQARSRPPAAGTQAPAGSVPAISDGRVRVSPPPSEPAHKTPIAPSMAGNVDGQPPRRRLKIDDDPFGATGDYAGSFLIKSAVELRGGYDTNPARLSAPIGDPLWVIAPEFLAVSDWERHALVADLRGSYTGYGHSLPPIIEGAVSPAPTDINRPDFLGHVDGRLDVTEDTRVTSQLRLRVATDNPGSPNVQAGIARYPDYATFGSTVGIDQKFNRLDIAAGATFDRTVYQNSLLTDGTTASNADRAFNQYGGVGRASYELTPAVKPFVEVEGDSRFHDQYIDNNGYARNSSGGYVRAGTSFEFSRLLTGEISIGYAARNYIDPRLEPLSGLLSASSLTWTATPLTTAKFYSSTSIDETTVPGVSGVLTHTYTFEVDHDFRRWLAAVGKFTYGTYEYQGDGRFDRSYSLEGDLIYKLTRYFWIKGTLQRNILNSNVAGASSASTVALLGVRVQN
jgi:hypothetical protein